MIAARWHWLCADISTAWGWSVCVPGRNSRLCWKFSSASDCRHRRPALLLICCACCLCWEQPAFWHARHLRLCVDVEATSHLVVSRMGSGRGQGFGALLVAARADAVRSEWLVSVSLFDLQGYTLCLMCVGGCVPTKLAGCRGAFPAVCIITPCLLVLLAGRLLLFRCARSAAASRTGCEGGWVTAAVGVRGAAHDAAASCACVPCGACCRLSC